ncbi:MAG TPA: DUF1931 family protein [Longimicrobium sp.]|nr:DUF1931 family protein [Longimicrobium sp.]
MAVISISTFEHFFRLAASLDVDKADLDRYNEFITRKINDLLIRGEATARANARDVIEPHDLPITKGLQESMQAFERLDQDQDLGLRTALEELTAKRPIQLEVSVATEDELPRVAGGLSVALARTFKILYPKLKNPQTEQWERSFHVFNLLL